MEKGGKKMIFYFSGTGNSYTTARFLADNLDE
jgi:flavodoxin